ncbi:MAG: cytochrome b/b6 domain-containing protein [Bryobacteraceae bacterium]
MKKTVYIYGAFERFWHWTQAALIFALGFTGFEIHGSYQFLGYEQAVSLHNAAAIGLLLLVTVAAFWHLTTGQWKQYIPTRKLLRDQAAFYLTGIFRDAPHPTRKTVISKLNPLQRLAYLGLKLLVIPTMGISGLFYMFFRYPQRHEWTTVSPHGLSTVAAIHVAGAFALTAFVIGHVYLTTTGSTPVSNLKAMLTGYEELDSGAGEEPEPAIPEGVHP